MSRRPPIGILVYNVDSTGGMERQAALLGRELARQGRRVVLVSTFFPRRGLGLGPGEPPLRERKDGVLLYRIPIWSNPFVSYHASQNLYELVATWLLEKHGVGTVYGVQAQTGGVHAARIAPVLERPAVVKLACSGSVGDIAVGTDTPHGRAVFEGLRSVERVVYLNEESRSEALGIGVAPEHLAHVPNGIDLARFADPTPAPLPELGPAEGRELVLFVGRLGHQKRAHVLLEAFALVAARRPRARLAIAGQGPDEAALRARIRALGLEGQAVESQAVERKVALLGVRRDVPALLRAASVFALPSAEEGQSNALLEAMAAGTPSVASDIPGNRALVRDGEEALLVLVDDAAALAAGIERLLEDRALATRLAAASRRRVQETFAIEAVAARYARLFDALPRRPRPSSARFLARYLTSRLWGVSGILAYVAAEIFWLLTPQIWAASVRAAKRVLGLRV